MFPISILLSSINSYKSMLLGATHPSFLFYLVRLIVSTVIIVKIISVISILLSSINRILTLNLLLLISNFYST